MGADAGLGDGPSYLGHERTYYVSLTVLAVLSLPRYLSGIYLSLSLSLTLYHSMSLSLPLPLLIGHDCERAVREL